MVGWEGCYPLEFNVGRNAYWIRKDSVVPTDLDYLPSRLGEVINYTPHYGKKKHGGNEMKSFGNDNVTEVVRMPIAEEIGSVSVFYKKSYKSETAVFTFMDGAEMLGQRVYIELNADRINFDFGDKGFRLNDEHKAEVWNGAHRFNSWSGNYKIKKDEKGYYILKEDCVLLEKQGNTASYNKPRKSKEEIAASILKDLIIEAVMMGQTEKGQIYAAAVKELENREVRI